MTEGNLIGNTSGGKFSDQSELISPNGAVYSLEKVKESLARMQEKTPREPKEKKVAASKMRRNEWIEFAWINVTEYGDKEPMYPFNGIRPIEQRKAAAEQFDAGKEKP